MSVNKKNGSKVGIIAVTVVLCATVAAIGGYFYQKSQQDEKPTSSITKLESEDDAAKGDADASLQYSGYATLLSDKKLIVLNFANPSKSRKSLDLEIVAEINGEKITLAKSEIVKPGYKLDSVKYELDREIPLGTYPGEFIVHFYDEQGKEEIVNSKIAIKIYVK